MTIQVRTLDGWVSMPADSFRAYLHESRFVFGYDQIETSANRIELLDLATPAFLDAVPNFSKLRGVGWDRIAEQLADGSQALRRLPSDIELWDWPDTLAHRSTLKEVFAACWFDHYSSASFTKLLHRKRPRLIPILDKQFLDVWHGGARWRLDDLANVVFDVGGELGRRLSLRTELREIAAEFGSPYSDLTTLRLYDIASYWCLQEGS